MKQMNSLRLKGQSYQEIIVHDPMDGTKALSEYLADFPQWAAKRAEVDLKRAALEHLQRGSDPFSLS